jgi:threonine aldolase
MNAVVAAGVPARELAADWDSVWIDFTKGLGAPLGAVLAGSRPFIDEVWRWKQRLGGAMRQAGLCAAACLYALDHNVERLADDHAQARRLAAGLSQIPGFEVQTPETNLVFFDCRGAGLATAELIAGLRRHGVLVGALGGRVRACTHLDVSAAMIDETLTLVRTLARAA